MFGGTLFDEAVLGDTVNTAPSGFSYIKYSEITVLKAFIKFKYENSRGIIYEISKNMSKISF